VKTIVELSEELHRAAKKSASAHGQTLGQFVITAVADKVLSKPTAVKTKPWMEMAGAFKKPWMKHYGRSADLADELEHVKQVIEDACEKIHPDDWK